MLVKDTHGMDGSLRDKKTAKAAVTADSLSGANDARLTSLEDLDALKSSGQRSDVGNAMAMHSAEQNLGETKDAFASLVDTEEDPAKTAYVKRWKTLKHRFLTRFEGHDDDVEYHCDGCRTEDLDDNQKYDFIASLGEMFEQVYCEPTLTFAEAMKVLKSSAPPLFRLSKYPEMKTAFDLFDAQLDIANKSSEDCYWFCFWSDFWENNSELDILKDHASKFSVTEPHSLMFKRMTQDQLENVLTECNLWNNKGSATKPHLFFPELLDRLYAEMGRADAAKNMTIEYKASMFQAHWQVSMPLANGNKKIRKKGKRPDNEKPPQSLQAPMSSSKSVVKVAAYSPS
jgi:hypothetical protein